MVQSAIAVADRVPVAPAGAAAAAEASDDLLKLFGSVSDGRSGQGRDHPVAAVLALAAAAVVAGMKGYTAIAGWVKDVPAPVLADLYMRAGARPAAPPSKATIWRVITDADAEVFDASTGSWLMSSLLGEPAGQGEAAGTGRDDPGLMPVRLDGKTVRGARDAEGNQRHLLAALVGRTAQASVIAAQAEVGVKTNEVPMATAVLGQIDLHGKLVTADALHTVKATAEFITTASGEFVSGQGEPQGPVRRAGRAALASGAHRALGHRPRPWPDHHPDHPGAARAGGPAVPARQPGVPDRTARH